MPQSKTQKEDKYLPRFAFEMTEEQKRRADKLLNIHGIRRAIFSPILDSVLDLIEKHGQIVTGLLIEKDAPRKILQPIVKVIKRLED